MVDSFANFRGVASRAIGLVRHEIVQVNIGTASFSTKPSYAPTAAPSSLGCQRCNCSVLSKSPTSDRAKQRKCNQQIADFKIVINDH
jgi:hypothetical protein